MGLGSAVVEPWDGKGASKGLYPVPEFLDPALSISICIHKFLEGLYVWKWMMGGGGGGWDQREGWREGRGGEKGGVERGGVERREGWRGEEGGEERRKGWRSEGGMDRREGGMDRREGWIGGRGGEEREECREEDVP